jgi:hypothetical protein
MEIAMMRDSRFHTCTPKPANLAEWRVQRAVKKFLQRDSTRGQTTPDAVPGPRGFIPDWQDNLNTARGIVYGCIAGALMWLTIYLLWPGK